MTTLIKKYISPGKIEQISLEKNLDKTSYEEFIRFLDYNLEQDDRKGFQADNHEENILEYVCEYIDEFKIEIEKGFSVPWTKEYVYNKLYEENQNPPAMAYYASLQINPQKASEDLKHYCVLTNRDELFFKHFELMIQRDSPSAKPSAETQAENYSKIFKEQIVAGKSEIFANKYADLMASDEYSELGCYSEAMEYVKALEEGFPVEYAEWFAEKISDYIANYYLNYEESLGDELVDLEKERLRYIYKSLYK